MLNTFIILLTSTRILYNYDKIINVYNLYFHKYNRQYRLYKIRYNNMSLLNEFLNKRYVLTNNILINKF
jgi:hypothetical protein